MDKQQNNAKKSAIIIFLLFIIIALICFGIFAYITITTKAANTADDRIITICKIIFMTGIFFLVVAFGHLCPLFKTDKNDMNGGIFSEINMRQILGQYIAQTETLLAGIHAISDETSIKRLFKNGVYGECSLLPDENEDIITLKKEKFLTHDIYIGITETSLLIVPCKKSKYCYTVDNNTDNQEENIEEVKSEIFFNDIGLAHPLKDIQNCQFKKGWMGSVRCFIEMKNGGYFKLLLPKFAGAGNGMPQHYEYREAIINELRKYSK